MGFNPSNARQRGFTLIEALVATMIVALALVAVTGKVSLAIKTAKRTQEGTFARWVAMNAIAEVRLQPGLPDTGSSDGDEEMAGTLWRWSMEITPNAAVEDVRDIEVKVAHAETPDKFVFSMKALAGNNVPAANVRPWSGWPDADTGGGRTGGNQPLTPGAPAVPGQQPDPRRGLDRTGSR